MSPEAFLPWRSVLGYLLGFDSVRADPDKLAGTLIFATKNKKGTKASARQYRRHQLLRTAAKCSPRRR